MEQNTGIQLLIAPEIAHKLQEVGANVTKRLDELNINSLVATEDTVKSLKELRAELNKELDSFEEQRKFVKNGVLNPYNEFEAIYKTEISERYSKAISDLKDKIASVETKIKDEKKAAVAVYFNELCASENITFLKFENIGLEINLSTSEKTYKEKCNQFILKIVDDLALIKTAEFEAEILTEYKKTLNASRAITTVKERKESEKAEAERLRIAEANRRISKLKSTGFEYNDFTKTYSYGPNIHIANELVQNGSHSDFTKKLVECEEKIKEFESQITEVEFEEEPIKTGNLFAQPKAPKPISAPIEMPAPSEEIVKASFEVSGTMQQLLALGNYMRENKITYKNI